MLELSAEMASAGTVKHEFKYGTEAQAVMNTMKLLIRGGDKWATRPEAIEFLADELLPEAIALDLQTAGGMPGIVEQPILACLEPDGLRSEIPFHPTIDMDPDVRLLSGCRRGHPVDKPPDPNAPPTWLTSKNCVSLPFTTIRCSTNCIEADHITQRMRGGDFGAYPSPHLPFSEPSLVSGVLRVVTLAEMVAAGHLALRDLSGQMWDGQAEASQMEGLNYQIANFGGNVRDFRCCNIHSTRQDIRESLSAMIRCLESSASSAGLDPVEWAIVMRPEPWNELTATWGIRCLLDADIEELQDVIDRHHVIDRHRELRNWMRSEMKLPIDGKLYDVVQDGYIPEQDSSSNVSLSPGTFSSAIYFLPLKVLGNFPVLYWGYSDYRKLQARSLLVSDNPSWNDNDLFWTDDGRLCWYIDQRAGDYVLDGSTTCRIVLRTPQLAGQLKNIAYTYTYAE